MMQTITTYRFACDRCDVQMDREERHLPDGWLYLLSPERYVDAAGSSDTKDNEICLCSACARQFHEWSKKRGVDWKPAAKALHLKRGSIYHVLTSKAEVQAGSPIKEGDTVAVYQGSNGTWWVRPLAEFLDGRFNIELLP